jgi:hypothetical protein
MRDAVPHPCSWSQVRCADLQRLTLAKYMAVIPSHIQALATGRTSLKCPRNVSNESPTRSGALLRSTSFNSLLAAVISLPARVARENWPPKNHPQLSQRETGEWLGIHQFLAGTARVQNHQEELRLSSTERANKIRAPVDETDATNFT